MKEYIYKNDIPVLVYTPSRLSYRGQHFVIQDQQKEPALSHNFQTSTFYYRTFVRYTAELLRGTGRFQSEAESRIK